MIRVDYSDRQHLAEGLAATVADQLADGVQKRGKASLAVSEVLRPDRSCRLWRSMNWPGTKWQSP
ncbi:MAG: hypothetical protein R3E95_16930 [Thiolinea sp.]